MSRLRTLLEARRRVVIMGILNRTPDSFSDGGLFVGEGAARARIEAMLSEGADIIDIGAESTRPGARPIPDDEQIARIGASVRDAARLGAVVSIDTTSPAVAERALGEGAAVVNSVSLEAAAALGAACARHGAALVLMHCRGAMSEMQGFSAYPDDAYADVVEDVAREWSAAAERAVEAGVLREDLVLDPGLGFAKSARHSLELCARLDELCALGYPVLVGPSRKSFLACAAAAGDPGWGEGGGARERGASTSLDHAPPEERLGGTIAAALACAARGAAMLRVHDVKAVRQALAVAAAIDRTPRAGRPAREDPSRSTGTGAQADA